MDIGLAGRVYLLTGASRGLGYATAAQLVADGANVVLSARDPDALTHAVDTLNSQPGRQSSQPCAVAVPADLTDPGTPAALLAAARDAFGRVDGALLSVGGPTPATVSQLTDDQWRAAFETVFLGPVRAARAILADLDASGAVGLVLSSSARTPIAGLGLSNGLRPGLAGVVKDLADEYGPHGLRVFGLLPHRILTDRNRELFAATGNAVAAEDRARALIPLRRLGDPDEFGRVAAFLLSPAASYLTGLLVPVDGGAMRTL